MSAAVAGTILNARFRPNPSYTNPRDVTCAAVSLTAPCCERR
jgi:hypothetical protein